MLRGENASGGRYLAINFGPLNKSHEADNLVDPRDIFNALPTKPPGMNFLRGPQDQVLEKWFARRDRRDIVVKLNTGGGKTVVGLLIAKSSSAEGKRMRRGSDGADETREEAEPASSRCPWPQFGHELSDRALKVGDHCKGAEVG